TAGAAAQVILLTGLTLIAGLGLAGWLAALLFAGAGGAMLIGGLRRSGAVDFGPADRVTLARAVLVGGVTALVVDSLQQPVAVPVLVGVAAVALSLDAVDGRVARRTGTCSPLGARFDMEVDAFLILVLSAYLATSLGAWVLVIGGMRYAFVVASWNLTWLRAPLPPSLVRKTVAATQGIALTVAASGLLPALGAIVLTALALAALVWSFSTDVLWLFRHRITVPARLPSTWTLQPAHR
ncbi:MAG TPA: CDP-alcohol phosphatidyltransferase family protein, partial [Micromonosporaceae bacterium]|nr:CDP-alcohol phosphatidyltransferase family protein [Micromonosporaceae bacterium]